MKHYIKIRANLINYLLQKLRKHCISKYDKIKDFLKLILKCNIKCNYNTARTEYEKRMYGN